MIWDNTDFRDETKAIIYKTVPRPILNHAAETKADTTENILEVLEMVISRKIGDRIKERTYEYN